MRLVDVDAILAHMADWYCYDDRGSETTLKQVIENAPTIDAEPVVHCKDCTYYIDNSCDCYSLYGDLSGDLIGVHFEPNEDFFCSYGERREP